MGVHKNIGADKFPRQGRYVGRRARVVFNYDTSREFPGLIVRDDAEEPFITLIGLDDGRYVRAEECQYAVDPP